MKKRMFAFDLDGTLLNDSKQISRATIAALEEMVEKGVIIALASGRIASSMKQFLPQLSMDVALLTLNGAAVFLDARNGHKCIYNITLDHKYTEELICHWKGKPFALNFYTPDHLYTVTTELTRSWIELYQQQTNSKYQFIDDFDFLAGTDPSKIIFVGDESEISRQEQLFREEWGGSNIYICRTWHHYLEFLNPKANKLLGIEALAGAYGVDLSDVVAFGDAENDIPMLSGAGLGIAMKNSSEKVKSSAKRETEYTNDDDGVAREWDRLKKELF
ncbi:Cof-type HAD-IIB family hydrolase [Chitinispirillales bacterium ANBcel5]|uniref:Cof-type HAD-IIB family hydrolase n=1 Tax=Cellulosispirillum alkaliphilum TaxID=3039283 RepID=UPI002A563E35|nr:Cof-type HAD-IIB family hydrolase [Chitinispirillales bacterium ANBcel5]